MSPDEPKTTFAVTKKVNFLVEYNFQKNLQSHNSQYDYTLYISTQSTYNQVLGKIFILKKIQILFAFNFFMIKY